ncbi:MAG: DUF6526 family protein [Sumerlaeia bacterium]
MSTQETQNFKNHVYIPKPALITVALLLITALLALIAAWRMGFQLGPLLLALAVIMNAICSIVAMILARRYATKLQDRIIRIEMRLRLEKILPENQQPKIAALTVPQLIGLRFASDSELPGLVGKVLQEKITESKPIKQLVKHWVPDLLRV